MPSRFSSLKYYVLTLVSLCMMINTASAQETEGEETPPSFSGIVVDYDTREPIEGATISWMKMVGMEENKCYGEAVLETQSGQDGSFTLEGVEYPPKTRLDSHHYVHLKAPGHESVLFLAAAYRSEQPTIPLHKSYTVSGIITGSNNEPIENALVGNYFFYQVPNQELEKETVYVLPSCWTFTDKNGRFQLDGVRNGIEPSIRVVADGYLSAYTDPVTSENYQNLSVTLHKGSVTLTGTILDDLGSPLPNRHVQFRPTPKNRRGSPSMGSIFDHLTTQANNNGDFIIKNLTPGKYTFHINRFTDNSVKYISTYNIFELEIPSNKSTDHVFQYPPPIQVSGRIINGETSQGIPNISVSSSQSPDTQTDQNGVFNLTYYAKKVNRHLHPIQYEIPYGFVNSSDHVDNGQYHIPDLDIEEGNEVIIKLYPTADPYTKVQLQITKPNEDPFSNCSINIGQVAEGIVSFKQYGLDSQGKTDISVSPNSTYIMKGYYRGQRDKDETPYYYGYIDFCDSPTDATVKLSPSYEVTGRIITEEGKPIPNFGIKLISQSEPAPSHQGDNKKYREYFESTDQNGEFHFREVIPGEITIANASFHTSLEFQHSTTIKPGQPTDLGDLVVETGKGISFQILKPEEMKMSGYRIQCFDGDKELKYHTIAHGDYRFTLTCFKETKGPLKLVVSPTNFETVTFENVELGTKDLKVNLVPVPTYSLRIVDQETGEEIKFINHKLEKYHDRMKQYTYSSYSPQAEEPPVILGVLEPGEYRVFAAGMTKGEGHYHNKEFDGRIGYTDFTVKEGDPIKEIVVPISSDYGVEIKGSVLLTNGFGTLVGGKVYLNNSQTFQPHRSRYNSIYTDRETTVDSNGCFTISKVLPGTYYLHFVKDDYVQKEQVKVIVEKDTPPDPQEILVYTTGKFQGEVTGLQKGYSLGLRLHHKENHKQYSHARTRGKGRFVFENPFPGENTLSISSGAHPSLIDDTITITPGETVERSYDLSGNIIISSKLRIDGKQLSIEGKKRDLDNLFTEVDYDHNNIYPEGFEPPVDKYLVPPGQYMLVYQGQMNYRSPIEFITIPGAEPVYELERNITSIPVNITFDSEYPFGSSNGDTVIIFSGTTNDRDLFEGDIVLYNSKPLTIKFFKPGTYTFSGKLNYKYKIDSGPIEIKKGENNITLKVLEMTPDEMEEYKQEQLEKRRQKQERLNR